MTLYKLVWHIKRQAAKAGMSMEDFLDWLKRADREGLLPWED